MKYFSISFLTTILIALATDASAKIFQIRSESNIHDYVLTVDTSRLSVVGNQVTAYLHLTAKQNVPYGQSVVLIPELKDTMSISSVVFPSIYLNSRDQQIVFNRETNRKDPNAIGYRKYKDQPLEISYTKSVPYQRWMETSVLILRKQSCGCCIPTPRGEDELCALRERPVNKVDYTPLIRIPVAEAVKSRSVDGQAFIRFKLDKWDLLPDYTTNSVELEKIYKTINDVKDNKFATIKSMKMEGYASPEGNLAHNIMLSENRTNSLKDYLKAKGILPNVKIDAVGMGENWPGFTEALYRNSSIPERSMLLSIANSNMERDAKENQMKRDAKVGFQYCLTNIFPRLRCTNYSVKYVVKAFNVEEAESVFWSNHPQDLSTNELYLVTKKYENDSKKLDAIMKRASIVFPDDKYVNLSMAAYSIKRNEFEDAENYLKKVPDSWEEKRINKLIIEYKQGKSDGSKLKKMYEDYMNKTK